MRVTLGDRPSGLSSRAPGGGGGFLCLHLRGGGSTGVVVAPAPTTSGSTFLPAHSAFGIWRMPRLSHQIDVIVSEPSAPGSVRGGAPVRPSLETACFRLPLLRLRPGGALSPKQTSCHHVTLITALFGAVCGQHVDCLQSVPPGTLQITFPFTVITP